MKQRVISGLAAGAFFLLFLFLGKIYYTGLILAMAAVGYIEYSRMNQEHPYKLTGLLGLLATLYLTFPWDSYPDWAAMNFETTVWFGMLLFFAITVLTKNKVTIDRIALVLLGSVYIGTGFHYMIVTNAGDNGLYWSLLLFVCIWGTDSGAYFTGRKFGKTLLWPAISPKKTVEGSLGGIAVSIIAALLFSFLKPELLNWYNAISIGFAVSVVGQLGDLIQSAYKRARNLKDTGSIIPGHGGILDRCDSWLIVFPFVHLFALIPQ